MARTVTMDDIAAKVGVSRATVSLAIRRSPKISAQRTNEILRIARELGYRPNAFASQLARTGFSTVGVLLAELRNPTISDILDGFAPPDLDGEPDMYLASGFNSREREQAAVESFLAHRVRGIVLIGSRLAESNIQHIAKTVPTAVVGREVEGVDGVRVDDELGGRLAADHLLGLGHRRLAHIDGGIGAGAERRKAAFLHACGQVDGASVRVVFGDYSQTSGYEGAHALFTEADRPTGIFAANDLMALGVLGAARDHGLRAGVDFALCGFDDIAISAYGYISLTSISYSREEMGRLAREFIDRRCAVPGQPTEMIKLQPSLVARGTSGARQGQS